MENSTASSPLIEEQHHVTASDETFRGSALRFVNRIGGLLGKPQQQLQAHHKQQQPQQPSQRLPKCLSQDALNMLPNAAKDIQQRGAYTEENQREQQSLLQRQHSEDKREEEYQKQEQPILQRQYQARHPEKMRQQQQGQQQSGNVAAGRRTGCTLLKSQKYALSAKGVGTHSSSTASFTATCCSATSAGAATLTERTEPLAELRQSAETTVNEEIYASQELPIIYAHSVAFQQAQPVGRLIPQNVRPPQNKVAAGLGPARMPPVLTGSPFFHCAPSSPQCPAISPHTPALAALPQALLICEEPQFAPVYSSLPFSSSTQSALQAFPASVATEEPVGDAAASEEGETICGLAFETVGDSAAASSADAVADPRAGVENPDKASLTTRTTRSTTPVYAADRPPLPPAAAAAAADLSCASPGERPEALPVDAVSETATSPAATAAGLPSAAGRLMGTNRLLDGEDETRRQRRPVQQGVQSQQQLDKQRRGGGQEGLKIITVPHQHAALFNYTVATLKRRLEESGQLSAICPSGIYLHEQLRSQQQPAFFAMLKEVNKNAADAASLSKRWQQGYSRNCMGLPAAAVAKLKELQQNKEARAGQHPINNNEGSRRGLLATTSCATASSVAGAETSSEHMGSWKDGKGIAKQGQSSCAAASIEHGEAPGVDKEEEKQSTGNSPAATVSAVPGTPSTAAASVIAAGGSKSVETLTVEDLVIKRGPPPLVAWTILGPPVAATVAASAQLLQPQQGHNENQPLPGGRAAADAVVQYQRLISGRNTLPTQQQTHDYGGTALQFPDATAAVAGKQEAPAYLSGEAGATVVVTGVYAAGGLMDMGGCASVHCGEGGAVAASETGASRIYLLQQQLEAQEKKVKHLERMLAQQRTAHLATRSFAVKSLRVGPGRVCGSSRQDNGHRHGSSCSSGEEAEAPELEWRQASDTRSSSRGSAACVALPADQDGDKAGATAQMTYSGRHEKDDLDTQVRRFLSSRTSLPLDKVLRQVKRGVYMFGDTKALVTKERSGKIVCEVLRYGGDVSVFAEEYKGKRLSLDRFWRLVCGRGFYSNP